MRAVGIAAPRQRRALVMNQQIIAPLFTGQVGDLQHCRRHIRPVRAEPFVVKTDLGRRHAHLIRKKRGEGVGHLGDSRQCRGALGCDRPRAAGAATLLDQITIALDHMDQIGRNASLVRQELCIDRLVPLPV